MTTSTVGSDTSVLSALQQWAKIADIRAGVPLLFLSLPDHVWHFIDSAPKRCGIGIGQNNASFLIHTTPPLFSRLVHLLLTYQHSMSSYTFLWWQESELRQVSAYEFCDRLLLWSSDFVWEHSKREQIERLRAFLAARQDSPIVESKPYSS